MFERIKKIFRIITAPRQDDFRVLFEQAPLGMAIVEIETETIRSVNENFAQLTGMSRTTLKRMPWSDVARTVSRLGEVDGGGFFVGRQPAERSHIHQLIRQDAVQVYVDVSTLARFKDRKGRWVCVLFAKDISEQIQAETQLRVSEQRLRLLTDSARDVVWTMTPAGEVTYVSPAVEALRGFTPAEAMKQTIDEILTPDSRDQVIRYFCDVAGAVDQGIQPPEFRSELEYWRKDGSKFWTEVLAFPVMGANGVLVEILGVSRDISQRRLYEESLLNARELAEKSNAAKTEFLAHISHEIRTPMSAILSLTDLVLNTPLDAQQKKLLNKTKSAGRMLLAIINDILDLAKLEKGKLVLAPKTFDVGDVLQQVSDLVSETCAMKGLRYEVQVAPDVSMYRVGDSQRLAQALLNLVGNAVKFTDRGHVQVSVCNVYQQDKASHLRFEVKDTGIGLSPALQTKVFEGFVQSESAQAHLHGGTGLGLAICKRLAQQMGGDVGVISEEGKGSVFWFTVHLPQADWLAEQERVQAPHKIISPELGPDTLVLLVEDNQSMREILTQLLSLAGVRVEAAENGQQAVQMIHRTQYDLVLMDMQMPFLGGVEATRMIRQNPANQHLPIVALTAGGFKEDRDRCLEAGMNDYLTKPFEYQDLILVLQRNIARKQTRHPGQDLSVTA